MMFKINNITVRTLVWFAAITVPFQCPLANACDCINDTSCCQKNGSIRDCCRGANLDVTKHGCCQQRTTGSCHCTGARVCRCGVDSQDRERVQPHGAGSVTKHGCCVPQIIASKPNCQCGASCRCKPSGVPTDPVVPPPVETISPENSTSELASTVRLPEGSQCKAARRTRDALVEADAVAALYRCATLCRFRL